MLELARDRAEGAHPYLTSPVHTAEARRVLGESPLLAPEQALVLEDEPNRARVIAKTYLERYLRLPNYRANLERLGFGEEDLAGQGSDRLVDALVIHGTPGEVVARVRAHLEAGADHVCVQPLCPQRRNRRRGPRSPRTACGRPVSRDRTSWRPIAKGARWHAY